MANNSPAAYDVHDLSTDKRRSRRVKVFLVAELNQRGDPQRAHVLDISAEGARLHAQTAPGAVGGIDLIVAGGTEPAEIVWTDHQRLGIRFPTPLSGDRLKRIIER